MADSNSKKSTPIVLLVMLGFLMLGTGALIVLAVDGFYFSGWLIAYWNSMTDAQASIISQFIFFLAAAWASVLVPILFGEQLRDLKAAAEDAKKTYGDIEKKLNDSVEDTKKQFKNISRYQQMALGYFANDGLLSQLETAEDKKQFIDNSWDNVEPKLMQALRRLNGNTRNSINSSIWRSVNWWQKIEASPALGEYCADFRAISDAKREVQQGADAPFGTLKKVNDALRRIRDFEPASLFSENNGAGGQSDAAQPNASGAESA